MHTDPIITAAELVPGNYHVVRVVPSKYGEMLKVRTPGGFALIKVHASTYENCKREFGQFAKCVGQSLYFGIGKHQNRPFIVGDAARPEPLKTMQPIDELLPPAPNVQGETAPPAPLVAVSQEISAAPPAPIEEWPELLYTREYDRQNVPYHLMTVDSMLRITRANLGGIQAVLAHLNAGGGFMDKHFWYVSDLLREHSYLLRIASVNKTPIIVPEIIGFQHIATDYQALVDRTCSLVEACCNLHVRNEAEHGLDWAQDRDVYDPFALVNQVFLSARVWVQLMCDQAYQSVADKEIWGDADARQSSGIHGHTPRPETSGNATAVTV